MLKSFGCARLAYNWGLANGKNTITSIKNLI
ncbi:helix-turn-helix domain-containing protein [Campylobacter hyointestinalis]|nr:helix-turn-helix domain-containing protein [Campylobacter hyointestinalis]